ncbi:Biofilm regulator BssS [Mycobacterium basiliense]|uniref:Biofilm regulator BssS n=1 Tax=Mycobacterium basiliense TaxID=2094119 RepID=A0A447G7Q3_9MYCO|nr:DUF4226 domain-containing protein [Mycobacterium basiliense]VDM86528.1 Biofilm regulator BssS [Mycobacterium basiliense]
MEGSRDRPQRGSVPAEVPSAPVKHERGAAAEAIADAEAALAHQNSQSSLLDLQVVSAILNAHLTAVEGGEALNQLQEETEAAVRSRSDLDTPTGARDFQRFLIGKLRDIRGVVANVSLDDTSKASLMAAWTSLYNASKSELGAQDSPVLAPVGGAASPDQQPDLMPVDPLLASLLLDDPSPLDDYAANQGAALPAPPASPTMPSIPGLGGAPAGATAPAIGPGPSGDTRAPLSGLLRGIRSGLDDVDERDLNDFDPDREAHAFSDGPDDDSRQQDTEDDASSGQPKPLPAGPTTVSLPNGETVTAASPELAAAIKAAAGGTPISDAFQQQGITIPPPGTPVSNPLDPAQVAAGDIGILTDRHALALGRDKALLDGQIQQVSSISGTNFLGWQHPPTAPSAPMTTTAPARTDAPTPTRPSGTTAAS